MPLPVLTDEQRKQALEKAAIARKRRAELQGQLKSGTAPNAQFSGFMERLDISASRRVRGLGAKQRESLLGEFAKK